MSTDFAKLKRQGETNIPHAGCGRCGATNRADGTSRCDCDQIDAALDAGAEALERVAALEAALQSTVAMIDAMQADEEPWETPSDLNNARALLAAPQPTATEEP